MDYPESYRNAGQQAAPNAPRPAPEISTSLNYLEAEAITLCMLANKLDEILQRLGRSLPAVPKSDRENQSDRENLKPVSSGHFESLGKSVNEIQNQRQRIAESIQKLNELF